MAFPVVLRPAGLGRFAGSAFLLVWLAFWVVGEAAVVLFLGSAVASVVASALGRSVAFGPFVAVMNDGTAPVFVVGLLLFLALWTVGGWAAGTTLLRKLAGEDQVTAAPDGLRFVRRAGPFSRTRVLSRDTIRRIRIRHHDDAVVADTNAGTVTIADLGTREERRSLQRTLDAALAVSDHARAVRLERDTPPHEWWASTSGLDIVLTSPPPRLARTHAAVGWGLTTLMTLVMAGSFTGRSLDPSVMHGGQWASLGIIGLIALGAVWLTWSRRQWLLRPGAMRIRLLLGSRP